MMSRKRALGLADSACSRHIFSEPKDLHSIKRVKGVDIQGVSGPLRCEFVGQHPLLGESLLVPELEGTNLISFGQLMDDYHVSITGDNQFLFTPKSGSGPKLAAGRNKNNVFPLSVLEIDNPVTYALLAHQTRSETVWSLHKLLCHAGEDAICAALDRGEYKYLRITTKDVRAAKLDTCLACLYGKIRAGHRARPGPDSGESVAPANGEHQHCDIVFVPRGVDKKLFGFVTAVDEATRFVYHQRILSKNAPEVLKAIRGMVEFHRGGMAKRGEREVLIHMHADSDSTFCKLFNDGDLATIGVKLVQVAPGVHERMAERNIQDLKAKMRSVIAGLPFRLPSFLLPDLYKDVVLAHNQTSHKPTGGDTPWFKVTGERVDGDHFQVPFGTVGVFHNPQTPNSNSLEAKGQLGIVIGRRPDSRALDVYLLDSNERVVRDKLVPLALPLPESVERRLAALGDTHPILALSDESLLQLETPNRRVEAPLGMVNGLSSEGVALPSLDRGATLSASSHASASVSIGSALPATPVSPSLAPSGAPSAAGSTLQNPISAPRGNAAGSGVVPSPASEDRLSARGARGGRASSTDGAAAAAGEAAASVGTTSDPSAEGVGMQESPSTSTTTTQLATSTASVTPPGGSSSSSSSSRAHSMQLRVRNRPENYALVHSGQVHKANSLGLMAMSALTLSAFAAEVSDIELNRALEAELEQLLDYQVFEAVDLTSLAYEEVRKAIPTVMLVNEKIAADGTFLKLKARFVIKGFKDRGDFGIIASPTISPEIVMIALNYAVSTNYDMDIFDVRAAFLEATLSREDVLALIDSDLADKLVAKLPALNSGRLRDGSLVLRLRKALYGLKEAPIRWYETLRDALLQFGFIQSKLDRCLFTRGAGKNKHIVLVHVDDILSVGPKGSMAHLRAALHQRFKAITEQVNPDKFNYLGMACERDRHHRLLFASQPKYIEKAASLLGLKETDQASTPFRVSAGNSVRSQPLEGGLCKMFASIVMLIHFVTKTRPDIRFAISRLTMRTKNPKVDDWLDLVQLAKYLHCTQDMPLVFQASDMQLHAAADASFAIHDEGRKSHSGGVFWLGKTNAPFFSVSKKQTLVSASTAQSELVALDSAAKCCVWLRTVLDEIGATQTGPCGIDQDNTACITLANTGYPGTDSKYIEVKYFWVKEQIDRGLLCLRKVDTSVMRADGMTKALPPKQYLEWRDVILNLAASKRVSARQ